MIYNISAEYRYWSYLRYAEPTMHAMIFIRPSAGRAVLIVAWLELV